MADGPLPVLVIGAGPAGLATAAELARRGIGYRLIERGNSIGHSWENLYDSLVLHTGRHMSSLPRRSYPRGTPLFPTRKIFLDYLRDYAKAFNIRVETGREVLSLRRSPYGWRATLGDGTSVDASAVVMATGIIANPRMPALAGRDVFTGRVLHSVDYRRPGEFAGQRVLVAGVGNSGGEIASELARSGTDVTVLVRSGANVVPREIGGVPIQYLSYAIRKLPRAAQEVVVRGVQRVTDRKRGAPVIPRPAHSPLDSIPVIGFNLVDAIKAGQACVKLAGIEHLTEDGVAFSDGSQARFDTVLLATGFAPALASLGNQIRTDAKGFALRSDRVTSVDQPGLYFVGHNYDATGGISNICRDAALVAGHLVDCRVTAARFAGERADAIRLAVKR